MNQCQEQEDPAARRQDPAAPTQCPEAVGGIAYLHLTDQVHLVQERVLEEVIAVPVQCSVAEELHHHPHHQEEFIVHLIIHHQEL